MYAFSCFLILFLFSLLLALLTLFNMIGSFPDKMFDRFGPIYYPPHQKQKMKKMTFLYPSKLARCDRWKCTMMVIFTTLWPTCVNWMELFLFTLNMECQLIFSPPRERVSTGQKSLHLNWGTSFIIFFELFQL